APAAVHSSWDLKPKANQPRPIRLCNPDQLRLIGRSKSCLSQASNRGPFYAKIWGPDSTVIDSKGWEAIGRAVLEGAGQGADDALVQVRQSGLYRLIAASVASDSE
ncbi:hypothetical protein, partial [Mesorhizobium sp. M0040]|uniref:hypothetical protein n=1 Tax=Mesorhizobium sp. M0040 TaxID=2956855 RepID=UPI0033354662